MIVSTRYVSRLLGLSWRGIEEIAARAGQYYEPFDTRKAGSDSKWRHIDNPKRDLKRLQTRIYQRILLPVPMPDTVIGGVRGRSVRDHAESHVGQSVVVTLDLRACFPNIKHPAVYDAYLSLEYSPGIARILTQLTTFQGSLPQGAPTSPALANLTLLDLHADLQRIAEERSLVLTQYVDDVAMSGVGAQDAIEPAIAAITRRGHSVARQKVHVLHAGRQQIVTGNVVNVTRSVERRYRQKLYARIHDLASCVDPLDRDIRSAWSQIAHVEQVNDTQGAVLQRLAERILPERGRESAARSKSEYRPCKHRRRHGLNRVRDCALAQAADSRRTQA